MRAPMPRSASTRSPIGRSCMRGTPESAVFAAESASAAVSGRNAVPALPRKRSAFLLGNGPPAPRTLMPTECSEITTPKLLAAPRCMTRVSSASSRPLDLGLARGERGEQQHAVGDALRARQPHRARRAARAASARVTSHRSRAARASAKSFSRPAPSPASRSAADGRRAPCAVALQFARAAGRGSRRRCRATSRDGSRRCA